MIFQGGGSGHLSPSVSGHAVHTDIWISPVPRHLAPSNTFSVYVKKIESVPMNYSMKFDTIESEYRRVTDYNFQTILCFLFSEDCFSLSKQ